jgi:hypothetical protein
MHLTVADSGGFEGSNNGGSHGDHARRSVDRIRRGRVDREPLFEQRVLGVDIIVLE